jgi:hypothetical protein
MDARVRPAHHAEFALASGTAAPEAGHDAIFAFLAQPTSAPIRIKMQLLSEPAFDVAQIA